MVDTDVEMKPAEASSAPQPTDQVEPAPGAGGDAESGPFLPGGEKLKREIAPDGTWVVEGKTFDEHMAEKTPEEIEELEKKWGFAVSELRTAVKVVITIRENPEVYVTPDFMASGMMWMINRSKSYKAEHRQLLKNIHQQKRKLQDQARKARDQSILQKTEMKVQRNAALQRLIEVASPNDPTVPAARLLSWKPDEPLDATFAARVPTGAAAITDGADAAMSAAGAAASPGAVNPLLVEEGIALADAEAQGLVKASAPPRSSTLLAAPLRAPGDPVADEATLGKLADAVANADAAARASVACGASDTHSAVVSSLAANELLYERKCHICKAGYRLVHPFYDSLCTPCGEFNFTKRAFPSDLRGRVIVVTGARIKIGFQIALRLLRCGATVIAATRFPYDAATRYAAESDYDDWSGRLKVHFLDLKNIPLVKAYCAYLDNKFSPGGGGIGTTVDVNAGPAPEPVKKDDTESDSEPEGVAGPLIATGEGATLPAKRKVQLTDAEGRQGGRKRSRPAPPAGAARGHGNAGNPVNAGAAPYGQRVGGGVHNVGIYGIVNNAAQTVARPPIYYQVLLQTEATLRHEAGKTGAVPAIIDTEWDAYVIDTVRPAEADVDESGRVQPRRQIACGVEKAGASVAAAEATAEGETNILLPSMAPSAAAAATATPSKRGVAAQEGPCGGPRVEDVTLDATVVASGKHVGRVEEDGVAATAGGAAAADAKADDHAAAAHYVPGIVTLPQRLLSRRTEVAGLHSAAEVALGTKLDNDMYDSRLSALDARSTNSWSAHLDEVTVEEAADVHTINALAPLVINSRLKRVLALGSGKTEPRYLINVSAMEGQFYRFKQSTHPHTNMAKAALNMMTRTSSADYAESCIYMSAVDTGWITDESPLPKAASRAQQGLSCPLDEVDAAARVLDLILTESKDHGRFWKDFVVVPW